MEIETAIKTKESADTVLPDQGALILYRDVPEPWILSDMLALARGEQKEPYLLERVLRELTELAAHYGLQGNLWHGYLAYILANHENAFSRACEITGPVEGSLNVLALHDFEIFIRWMRIDIRSLGDGDSRGLLAAAAEYVPAKRDSFAFNHRIRDRICRLADSLSQCGDPQEFYKDVTAFYKDFGVGKFGLHKAFRIVHPQGKEADVEPITCTEHVSLDQLIGYEIQKKKLIENTENFVQGRAANNCLLFGDAGTGKSSSIKAILNEYYPQGLRMIEVYKHQFQDLSAALAKVKDRNYKFIIFMDDLSFEEFEIEYKYLKAVIEGGLEKKPDNVLIYATSNRRHLIRESFNDKPQLSDELHINDTVQEKLSLVARFGVTIYFGSPNKKEFQTIVKGLAEAAGVDMPEEELYAEANKWELSHGGLSGRTARQFITYLKGKEV